MSSPRIPDPFNRDNFQIGPAWPRSGSGLLAVKFARGVVRSAVKSAEFLRDCGLELGITRDQRSESDAVAQWLDARGWPARPLRVGLIAPGQWAAEIVAAHGVFVPEWLPLHSTGIPERIVLERQLDAVVYLDEDGGLHVLTAQNPGHKAFQNDWLDEPGNSYPALFPARLDTHRATLGPAPTTRTQAAIVRLLIEAAAIGARHPQRVTLEDRLAGRTALGSQLTEEDPNAPVRRGPEPFDAVMRELAITIAQREDTSNDTAAMVAAARVLGAWAATREGWVDDAVRRTAAEVAVGVLGEDALTHLRVAAVRLLDADDSRAFDSLRAGFRLLQGQRGERGADQIAFLHAELSSITNQGLAVGRVCAGLTLLAATQPAGAFQALREDVLDEARFSALLVERDQDRALVLQVMNMLDAEIASDGIAISAPRLLAIAREESEPTLFTQVDANAPVTNPNEETQMLSFSLPASRLAASVEVPPLDEFERAEQSMTGANSKPRSIRRPGKQARVGVDSGASALGDAVKTKRASAPKRASSISKKAKAVAEAGIAGKIVGSKSAKAGKKRAA